MYFRVLSDMLSSKKTVFAVTGSCLALLVIVCFRSATTRRQDVYSLPSASYLTDSASLFPDMSSDQGAVETYKETISDHRMLLIPKEHDSVYADDHVRLKADDESVIPPKKDSVHGSNKKELKENLKNNFQQLHNAGFVTSKDYHLVGREEVSSGIEKWISDVIINQKSKQLSVADEPKEEKMSYANESSTVSVAQKQTLNLFSHDKLVRNCITGEIIGQIPANLRTRQLVKAFSGISKISPENGMSRKMSFSNIFHNKSWGHSWEGKSSGLSVSGRGATLGWTQEAIAGLHALILGLKSFLGKSKIRMLDAPCGDMTWMSRFLETRDDVEFVGIDVVPELITNHRQMYKGRGWEFLQLDIVEDELPGSFDLIVSRAFIQHLYHADVLRVLRKFSQSGSKYLFATTFPMELFNAELDFADNPGRFRELNLEIPPFSLIPPLCIQRDGPPYDFEGWKHFLGLWTLPLLQVVNCDKVKHFRIMNTDQEIYSCVEWSPYLDLS